MRKTLLIIFLWQAVAAFAQVGVHTDNPDNSSAMDIVATNRGLLIPRVTLTADLASPSPITAPAVGLLVFNSGANQPVGFYYWNGTSWTMLTTGSPSGNYWSITGNSGTVPGTNFLGTTDNNHFVVYTNNAERMRFESDGQIVIDSIAPRNATDLFSVIGNASQTTTIAAYPRGTGFYTKWGRYGLVSLIDTAANPNPGFAVYSRNYDALGYGTFSSGSGITSFPLLTSHTSGVTTYGVDGLDAWARNADGYGIFAIGSNLNTNFNIAGVSAGISAIGNYGIVSKGNAATGRGIVAVGSAVSSPSTSNESEGGAFTGYHGAYAKGTNANGIGVIGIGSNAASYSTISGGIGGSFTGGYGAYGKGVASDGVGILGLGSNGAGYYTVTGGSGGAFTGYHGALAVGTDVTIGTGVIGAGNNGSYVMLPAGSGGCFTGSTTGAAGFGTSSGSGIGVIGAGNNQAAWVPSNGCGGAFTGNYGVFCRSVSSTGTGIVAAGDNIANPQIFSGGSGGAFTGDMAGAVGWGGNASGTGVIGAGNAIATPSTYASGSGGAFTGTAAGSVSYATTAASGVGVIGAGNNTTPVLPGSSGCGGAFTGTVWGVYGYASNSSSTRGGGYFACNPTSGGAYAYCGYRNNSTNYKTIGNGTNSTIVKNTQGELITLYCPEAPEVVFQDYGIGQLVDGFAHITLDPDLVININVSATHPMKVFITPEGDCNGVYVTNKSSDGFDVVELMGGRSNVSFSWQIVATRANEQTILRDGSVEATVYDIRFGPAPGPLETDEQLPDINQVSTLDNKVLEKIEPGRESFIKDQPVQSQTLQPQDDKIIMMSTSPDE